MSKITILNYQLNLRSIPLSYKTDLSRTL